MPVYPLVEHVHCESAGQFIDSISPLGSFFRHFSAVERWIFRGHGNDTFKLIPSALRDHAKHNLHNLANSSSLASKNPEVNISQWVAEAKIVRDFFLQADSSGLQLPEDSQVLRISLLQTIEQLHGFEKPIINGTWEAIPMTMIWPRAELLSLVALAQHYGLPTRLLDWSRSPFAAAYFAAIDACTSQSACIAVWALLATELSVGHALRGSTMNSGIELRLITAPRAANPNLHAQDGLFTMCVPVKNSPIGSVDRRAINELLTEADNPFAVYSPLLFHFTLPSSEAGKLLWYLDKQGVNAAKLFPSFDGAAKAIKDRQFQRAPNEE